MTAKQNDWRLRHAVKRKDSRVIDIDYHPLLVVSHPNTDEEKRRAAVVACGVARDADEAAMFLDQLGLTEDE